MKLENVIVIFLLGVVRIAQVSGGMCVVRTPSSIEGYWLQCFRSNDYLKDLNKSPVDINLISFSTSRIPIIRNESFARFNRSLEGVKAFKSGVEEIEDNAFRGLGKLKSIDLENNKLQIVKSVWFRDLPSLVSVLLKGNQIKYRDDDFFAVVPPLHALDLSDNQLTCIPLASISKFNTTEFTIYYNPLTWTCQNLLLDALALPYERAWWFKADRDLSPQLANNCIVKLPSKFQPNGEFSHECAEKSIRNYLLAKGSYTIQESHESLVRDLFPMFKYTDNQ